MMEWESGTNYMSMMVTMSHSFRYSFLIFLCNIGISGFRGDDCVTVWYPLC